MAEKDAPGEGGEPAGPRRWLGTVDRGIDAELNRYFSPTERSRTGEAVDKYAARVEESLVRAGGYAKRTKSDLDVMGDGLVARFVGGKRGPRSDEANIGWITGNPKKVVLAVVLLSLLVATPAVYIQGSPRLGIDSSMRGDFEVFLSPTDESTTILNEVRENWAVDAMFIYGEMLDPGTNVTDLSVLKALSAIEGDDDHPSPPAPDPAKGYQPDTDWSVCGLDPWREDEGVSDGVTAVLSIPVIVKAINQTTGRVVERLPGNYSIPNQQSYINRIIDNAPSEELRSMVADVDKDGIYDHFAIIVLLRKGPKVQLQVMEATQELIDDVNAQWEGTMKLWLTGPTPVIEAMQKRTISEFVRVMPLVVGALCIALYAFHRTWKVIPIALVPVGLGLIMSLGIVGALHDFVIITPQVVIVAPVMLSLGVSYGLYISNRFAEEPGEDRAKRIARATKAINPAIFLSAITTAIGFFSLMIGTLPPILTMGLGLTVGIMLTYILVYILVPAFIMMLRYEKRATAAATAGMRAFATFPSRNRKKIVAFALVAATLSVVAMPLVRFDADYLSMAPSDEPSVVKMAEYSANMGGGQMGMVLIRRDPYLYDTLAAMERMENELNAIKDNQALSVVAIMKAVAAPESVTVGGNDIPIPAIFRKSLWDAIVFLEGRNMQTAAQTLINTFYDALPAELREMLISTAARRALIYSFMPFMDIDSIRAAVDGVNGVVASFNEVYGPDFSSKLTGIAAITLAVNDLIIVSQINSLAVCMILTILILAVTFRSIKVGLLTVIPVTCVISLEPGTLVMLNIPLSTITVMIGSIAIGTGVDFAIQISQRVRLGHFKLPAVFNAVENAGTSFVEATSTMLFGFVMCMFIPIDSIKEFVVMIMVLLTYNAVFALFLMPAVFTLVIRFREARALRAREGRPKGPGARRVLKAWLSGYGDETLPIEPPAKASPGTATAADRGDDSGDGDEGEDADMPAGKGD